MHHKKKKSNKLSNKLVFCCRLEAQYKIAWSGSETGSLCGSISQRQRSADPDP